MGIEVFLNPSTTFNPMVMGYDSIGIKRCNFKIYDENDNEVPFDFDPDTETIRVRFRNVPVGVKTLKVKFFNKLLDTGGIMAKFTGDYTLGFGYYHSLFLTETGKVYGVGYSEQGQVGYNSTATTANTVLINYFDNEKVIKVAAGERHSAAITESGKLYMWGLNNNGQLGLGDTTQRNIPTLVDPAKFGNEKIVDVGLGGWSTNGHTIALTETGKVYAWGLNGYGQLGINNTTNQTNPVLIAQSRFNNEKVVKITVGAAHSGCITETGKLYMWGNNHLGYLGDGTTTQRNVPTLIPQSAFNNEKVVALSLGRDYSGCLTETGKVYMWGRNTEGQLGDGTTTDKSVPTLIPQSAFNNDKVAALSLGVYHSGCVTETGKVYMWGFNGSGQLGDGTTANKSVPTLIYQNIGDKIIVGLHLGGDHTGAITKEGKLYTWGRNDYYKLADGTLTNRSVPTLIPSSKFGNETIQIPVNDITTLKTTKTLTRTELVPIFQQ